MDHSRVHKVLLLGTSESGKSCVRRMFEYLTPHVPQRFSEYVINMMCAELARMDWKYVAATLHWEPEVISGLGSQKPIEIAYSLWLSGKLQEVQHSRHKFPKYQGIENLCYLANFYFSSIDKMMSQEETFHLFITTSGVIQEKFDVDGNSIFLVDPGGAKSQRRKWPIVWKNTNTIVFCASLSCFRLILWEDGETNRFVDSLKVFDEMTSREEFHNCTWYLLLTHRDILEDCLPSISREELRDLINGEKSVNAVIEYIVETYATIFQRNIGAGLKYQFIKMNGDTAMDIVRGNFIPIRKNVKVQVTVKFSDVVVLCE